MKITGTRSCVFVEFDHRTVKIAGELTTVPAFYADIRSIKNWEPPYDNVEITEKERQEIIERVIEYNSPDFKIIYEE